MEKNLFIDVELRTRNKQRQREKYVTFELDYLWNLNNYCKLKMYDFEIYAVIDVYSRYIIWIYIEVFERTTVNVVRQYFDMFERIKNLSLRIRSNKNEKTNLTTHVHYDWLTIIVRNTLI